MAAGNYLDTVDSDWFNQRLIGMLVCLAMAFALLIGRLLYLQIIEGDEYRRLSESNSIRLQDIDPPRGLIFDRNGRRLVDNRPAYDLKIIPRDAKPLEATLARLADLLGVTPGSLLENIRSAKNQSSFKPILLQSDISRDMLAAIEVHRFDLPGIEVVVSPKRQYVYDQHAAHLLGYMSEISPAQLKKAAYKSYKGGDYIGQFGIEKSYESVLRGLAGGRQVEVTATGQMVRVLSTVPAQPGRNLILTIDQSLQSTAETLLEGKAGSAVAVDPDSGQILALVSSPSFDQNIFVGGMSHEQWNALINNPQRPLENKAIQAEYPPASTYKIITAMAGLEEGVIDENTTFFCPGFYKYGNRIYRCWKRAGHGEVNVVKALKESCDVFFYQVGEALGVDRLAWYAKAAGLGERTGIHLAHEARGLIPTAAWKLKRFGEPWQGGETLSVAIGQGFNLVTPLQMALMTAAVGNGGTRYKPQLVRRILSADGEKVFEAQPEPVGHLPISAGTLDLVHRGLWAVVNEPHGTAHASRIKGLPFAGKTGTAQVIGRREGDAQGEQIDEDRYKDHAWFVAYAPAVKPRIAIAVMVEHGEHGSSAAAPIAAAMIRTYLGDEAAQANWMAPDPIGLAAGGKPLSPAPLPATDARGIGRHS